MYDKKYYFSQLIIFVLAFSLAGCRATSKITEVLLPGKARPEIEKPADPLPPSAYPPLAKKQPKSTSKDILSAQQRTTVEEPDERSAPSPETKQEQLPVGKTKYQKKQEKNPPPPPAYPVGGVGLPFVKSRLDNYAKQLTLWNDLAGQIFSLDLGATWPPGWHECVQGMEMVHFKYLRLYESLQGGGADNGLLWQVMTEDIQQKSKVKKANLIFFIVTFPLFLKLIIYKILRMAYENTIFLT